MGWVPEHVALTRHENPYRLTVEHKQTYEPGTVEVARPEDRDDWEAYAARHPDAHLAHGWAWHYKKFSDDDRLAAAEVAARNSKLGIKRLSFT